MLVNWVDDAMLCIYTSGGAMSLREDSADPGGWMPTALVTVSNVGATCAGTEKQDGEPGWCDAVYGGSVEGILARCTPGNPHRQDPTTCGDGEGKGRGRGCQGLRQGTNRGCICGALANQGDSESA